MLSSTIHDPVGCRANDDVWHDRLDRGSSVSPARLGIEAADLRDHVENVDFVDTADPPQLGDIAASHEIQPCDQRLHRGIEAVAVAQLDGQALGEITRADAGGVERLHGAQHGLGTGQRHPQPSGDLFERLGEVPAVVDGIDQRMADDAVTAVGHGERKLCQQVVFQRSRGGKVGLEVGGLSVPGRARPTGPGGGGQSHLAEAVAGCFGGRRRAVVVEGVAELGAEAGLERRAVRGEALRAPIGLRTLVEVAALRQIGFASQVALARRAVGNFVGARLVRAFEQGGCAPIRPARKTRARDWRTAEA